jgi:hypothetical protein
MPSLKAEIATMQNAYLVAENKLKNSITQKQRGTENHRNVIRAIFRNSCAYLRQLVAAGLLPATFSIGHNGTNYVFRAYTDGHAPIMTKQKEPKGKAEKQPLTQAQKEQKRALKALKQSYEWCRAEMDASLKAASVTDRSYRGFVQYSRDLDSDYLEIRQELGILPKNLQLAVEKALHFVCFHGEGDSIRCTAVETQAELDRCLELNKQFIAKHRHMSEEDQAMRAKFEEEFSGGFKV